MKKQLVNQNKINEIEINSFLKEWLRNTNEEIEIDDIRIKQKPNMIHFYREFLESFLKNKRRHRIVGADKMLGFEINIANDEELLKVCKDIWDNPENYYKLETKEENYYYEFLKFLWVESDTYGDVRITDLIETKINA